MSEKKKRMDTQIARDFRHDIPCNSSAVQATVSQVLTYDRKMLLVQMQVRLWMSQPATEAALYIHSCCD